MTPNRRSYGPENGQNDAKERRKEEDKRGQGKKDYATFSFIFNLATYLNAKKHLHCKLLYQLSKKHHLSEHISKNPGK